MKKTALTALLALSALSMSQADILWDGSSSGNWSNAKNWSLNRLPNLSENVVFPDGITRKALTNDLGTPLFFKMVFRDDGYTLTGTPIRLGAGGIELVDSSGFVGPVTLGTDIQVLGSQTFFVGGTATEKDPHLVLNGDINLRTFPLTVAGGAATIAGEVFAGAGEAGELIFSGAGKTISPSGRVTLPAGRVVQGLGDLSLDGRIEAQEMLVRGVFPVTGGFSRFTGSGVVAAAFSSTIASVEPRGPAGAFGRLTFLRQTTLGAACSLVLRLGSPATPGVTHDQVRISGSLQFKDGAGIRLEPGAGFAPEIGQTFVIIDKTSAGSLSGSLGFVEGAILPVGNTAAVRLSHTGGDGNDLSARVIELPPSISKISDQVMTEDGQLNVGFTIADPNTSVSRLSVTATARNASVRVLGTGSSRTLQIQPEPNFFGSAIPVTVSVTDGVLSATQIFNVQAIPVNDAPSFTAISPLSISPNSARVTLTAADSISVGPGEAATGQKVQFDILANSNPGLFREQPVITPEGQLICTPFDVEGTAVLSVRVVDDGGTANGGVNASAPQQIELRLEFPPVPQLITSATAWIGGVSSNWNTSANWSGNAVPRDALLPSVLPSGRRTLTTIGGVFFVNLRVEGDGYRILDNFFGGATMTGSLEVEAGNTFEIDPNVNHIVSSEGAVFVVVHENATLKFNNGLRSPLPINNPSGFTSFPQIKAFNLLYEPGGQVIFAGESVLEGSVTAINVFIISGPGRTVVNGTLGLPFVSVSKGSPHVMEVNGTLNSSLSYSRSSALSGQGGVIRRANAGGRIQPGGSQPGVLNITELEMLHDPAKDDQSVLELDLGSNTTPGATYDQLRVGSVRMAGGAALSLRSISGFAPVRGQTYLLVQVAGNSGGRTGFFDGLPEGGSVRVDGADLRISYLGGDGNDITATVTNAAPIILGLRDVTINEDGSVPAQTVTFANIAVPGLTISLETSNPSLVPLAGISVTGTGSVRTLNLVPLANQHGTTRVTVSADDGTAVGSSSFEVTVLPVNDAPSFTRGPDVFATRNGGAQVNSGWAAAVSAGPANENTQTASFEIVSNSNPGLFSVTPTVSPAGELTFTPNAQVSGSALLGLRLKDNGGTERGGQDSSAIQTFTITTLTSNTPPTFTALGNVRVTAGTVFTASWATVTSKGAPDESGQSVIFLVETSRPELFAVPPTVDPDGVLSLSPLPGAGGEVATLFVRARDNGGTLAGGVDTSPVQSFAILIETNAPPQAAGLQNQQLREGAGQQVQAFRIFGSDVASPAITVETSIPALIPAANIALTPLAFAGTISYTPLPQANGSATLTLTINDGNAATSTAFVVTVTAVNDEPTFLKGPDVTVPRGAGPQALVTWASDVSAGPPDEAGQTLSFEVTNNSNPGIFSSPPSVNAAGTLTFTPNRETSGVSTIGLRLRDDGGTADGGADTSAVQFFTVTTQPTNNAPTFTPGPVVEAPSGVTTIVPWATDISAGAADEAAQTLSFTVESTRPEFFSTAPALSPSGELSVSPVAGISGEVTLVVQLRDDGGTGNGGVDRGPFFGLTLRIGDVGRTPGSYFGLADAAPGTAPEHARAGRLTVTVAKPGFFTGRLTLGGVNHPLKGTFNNDGEALFGRSGAALPLARHGLQPLSLRLRFSAVSGDGRILGTISDAGQPIAILSADRAIYDRKTNPMLAWIVDGQGNKGRFTAAFSALEAPNGGLESDAFPQGDGWASLRIGLDGTARLAGQLADGTALTMYSRLTEGNRVAFHAPLYRGKGSLSGRARYQNLETSDANGSQFLWFRPAQLQPRPAPLYPNGWPGGIHVDLEASRFVASAVPYLSAPTPADADANLLLTFDDLPQKAASLDSKNKITLAARPDAHRLAAVLTTTGRWTGTFLHPGDLKKKSFQGVILQKSNRATGFYLGPQGSRLASFTLVP